MNNEQLTYESSGVSISAQDEAIEKFKAAVTRTHGPEVLAGVGAFGAAFAPALAGIQEPVLVSSTDSLGTKTMLHARFASWHAAGQDVVGCVVNDIIVSGARPLFFLDYLALNKIQPDQVSDLVTGVAEACQGIDCALIGGELAEMNDVYRPGDFDLVGFAVGLVDRAKMLDCTRVAAGDILIGLPSSGVHCNGFSLVRRALADWTDEQFQTELPELTCSLREALLAPTVCYANQMSALLAEVDVRAAAHISGGGLIDNIPRVLPEDLMARVDRNIIKRLPVFDIIQRAGNVDEDEMWHVFNMGVGFVVIVSADEVNQALAVLGGSGMQSQVIGEITAGKPGQQFCWKV